jgi:hypothetical protein
MKFLRTLHTDLRERQILPAVVLLAVLAVAIPIGAPMLFGKVSAPPPVSITEPRVVLPKGVAPPSKELASLTTVVPVSSLTRRGAEPNPFREAGGSSGSSTPAASTPSKAAATTKTKSTTSTSTPAKTTPAKTTPAKTTPAKTTPAKTTPAKTKPATGSTTPSGSSGGSGVTPAVPVTPTTGPATLKSTQAYSVNIDTKDANGLHILTDVVRLAPLPAAESPELIFLGVLQGGKKAAFLFTNSVKVSNQSGSQLTCLPSPDDCQIVELSPGQGMKLAPTSNTALITTFTFELMSIGATNYSSAAAAKQARDAVSTAGQTLVPLSNSTALRTLRFDDKIGALVHQNVSTSPPSGATGSTGSTAATGATGSSGSTGATGGTSGNAERFPNGVAFVLNPVR